MPSAHVDTTELHFQLVSKLNVEWLIAVGKKKNSPTLDRWIARSFNHSSISAYILNDKTNEHRDITIRKENLHEDNFCSGFP